jgi:hypothetical protein
MFYYLMLAFLIFIGFLAHLLIAGMTHSLLEDSDSTGWYKSKYKKYLLIPGLAEVVLALYMLVFLGAVTYAYIIYFIED